ncbi:MAG: recombination mediator RecR, partial [Candidatus Saccharibacteria bacterium]|nr:recombination mediator RecR [Candidatus Saccharibacteria bacterium]
QILPPALVALIESFGELPGVGPRTAERYAHFLFKSNPAIAKQLADSAQNVHEGVGYCTKTFALVKKDQNLSELYTDPDRDKQIVAVVAEPFDIIAIEKTGQYKGTYHVLGGLVSPIDGIGPEQLHIDELLKRVKEDKVQEIILATNASVEGESTALYIQKRLLTAKKVPKISRLARGLPVGIDLEYADQITLGRALEGRTIL